VVYAYCIVLIDLRLFSNMGDTTHPFRVSLYITFMQKVRIETPYTNKIKQKNRFK